MAQYDDYGERWFRDETPFEDDLAEMWGRKWSLASEVGKLQAVLLRRPGKEIEHIGDPAQWRWREAMDPGKARAQHDALAEIYRQHGADVYYVEDQREDRPNALYMRDNVLGTPEGAIVCRHALRVRRGEERAVAATLAGLGVPIVRTISGRGVFEGACGLWIDRETIILGTGVRANAEGVRQVEEVLRPMGVTNILTFQIPYGHAHVDGLMNIVDVQKALIFPWQTPYDVVEALQQRGFTMIEAPSIAEVKEGSAVNVVALEPGNVVMPAGNPETRKTLEQHGVGVIELDVSELMKGFGSLHCMSAFLARAAI
ncbi:amidinotransferase [candidate division KSB3 bacterium]|uniref:Amidinotransferase n=1 Tax=candidate division KSB3 bacterium TaxID=2044937 RepID=A0A9D5Q502_9BACT|nr:amidinotransferase [candidate division KSB3 bacterium]MBD3324284.1 amidinotransferase [candidate division KSB3 bacterium]